MATAKTKTPKFFFPSESFFPPSLQPPNWQPFSSVPKRKETNQRKNNQKKLKNDVFRNADKCWVSWGSFFWCLEVQVALYFTVFLALFIVHSILQIGFYFAFSCKTWVIGRVILKTQKIKAVLKSEAINVMFLCICMFILV